VPLEVVNPYNRELVVTLPYDEGGALEAKLAAARDQFTRWSRLSLDERIAVVKQGVERLQRDRHSIARDITAQMGKPIAQSLREVDTCGDRAQYLISIAREALSPELVPAKDAFVRRIEHVPHGIVLDIAAWNYPLLIAVNVVVPALLAGNTVVLKHSGRTPLCGMHFARAFHSPGFPALVTSLVLTHEATASLVRDPRVDHVAFTGSVEGGREINLAAAQRFIEVGLELGGKDPAYVAEDADLPFAVENVVDGACYNAGQSCCAVERVYVHRKVYRQFLDGARAELARYRLGDPMAEATTMGPLAREHALADLEAQVKDAVQRGARLLAGGSRLTGARGYFFSPTLLADVPNDAVVMQEETFGPIVPVLEVSSDEEAIRLMNATRYGLTASVWTRDAERAERVAREVNVGTIYQNRCDFLDPALAWTGMRDSGRGTTLSRFGFLHLTRRKSLHFRTRT
jgi:acyl-CoA reductase-like NAD-dependent aldehyde dehydrogenase